MVGAFETRTIEGFLKRLSLGKETSAIERYDPPLPNIVQREPWDGKDGKPPSGSEDSGGNPKDEMTRKPMGRLGHLTTLFFHLRTAIRRGQVQ